MMACDIVSVSLTLPLDIALRIRQEGLGIAEAIVEALKIYVEASNSFRPFKKANPDEPYNDFDFMPFSLSLPVSLMDRVEKKASEYVLVSCRSKMDVFVEDALNFYLEVEAYEDDKVLWNIHYPSGKEKLEEEENMGSILINDGLKQLTWGGK